MATAGQFTTGNGSIVTFTLEWAPLPDLALPGEAVPYWYRTVYGSYEEMAQVCEMYATGDEDGLNAYAVALKLGSE